MSDSQRPNPLPSFEVPDLELEPVPRSMQAPPARQPANATLRATPLRTTEPAFGALFDFGDELGEFERSAPPNFQIDGGSAPRLAIAKRAEPAVTEVQSSWPSGQALDLAELEIDPRELAVLADYGEPPDSPALTLAYAYRVFTRQRELKQQLIPIAAECERAQAARERTLAELARGLRPAVEQRSEFRRFFASLLELEQRAAERGRTLTAINAQLDAETNQFDAVLTQISGQLEVEAQLEREAQRQHEERQANAKRADAKLKRVQIEIRAVTHLAEQKLGPQAGQVPEPEAAQLATLQQRAEALEPEIAHAREEFEQAQQALNQVRARLGALRQNERQITRKKQAYAGAYQKELSLRSQGLSENEIEQRSALAELGRALLATRDTALVPEAWLERVRQVSDRANKLSARAELQRRAIAAYDAPRARQGVKLACTAALLLLLSFAFKLIF